MEVVELKFWVFRLYERDSSKVCVQGYMNAATTKGSPAKMLERWRSSPIAKWLSPRRLITDTGREYVLKGSMDLDQAFIFNYSQLITEAFKNGFPVDWKALLRAEHGRLHSSLADGSTPTIPFHSNTAVLTNLTNIAPNSKKHPRMQSPQVNHHRRSFHSPQPTPMNAVCRVSTKKQLVEEGFSGGVRVSRRSGRVLKQPLQSWMGERIVYDVDGNPIEAHAITTKEQGKPDVSEQLAAICDGLGVGRVEPSKQTHRRSLQQMMAEDSENKNKRRSSGKGRKRLVDYSESDSDSFLAFVDRVRLSPPPENRKFNPSKSFMDNGLTPIPLKHHMKNRRAIFSPEEDGDSEEEEEEVPMKRLEKKSKKKRHTKRDKGRKKATKKPSKPWTADETKMLKIALGATSSTSTLQWEVISRCISGGKRSVVECQEKAAALNMMPGGKKVTKARRKSTIGIRKKKSVLKKKKSVVQNKKIPQKRKKKEYSSDETSSASSDETDNSFLAYIDNLPLSPKKKKNVSVKPKQTEPVKKKPKAKPEEEVVIDYIVEEPPDSTAGSTTSSPDQAPKRNRRWMPEETQRLMRALKLAVNPQTEKDWAVISQRIGGMRDGQECREHAMKLKWKPPTGQPLPTVDSSPDSSQPCCSKSTRANTNKRSMAEADFFGGRQDEISCLTLDPDDSLYDALQSPEHEPKNMRMPFIKRVLNETIASYRRSHMNDYY